MSATELRQRLAAGRDGYLTKLTERIAIVEWWRPWAAGGAVAGALVAGLSRLFTGDLSVGLAVGGAVFAAVCGLAIALMDYKKLEISGDARSAHALVDDALAELETCERQLTADAAAAAAAAQAAKEFDARRHARIEAVRLMIETLEAALLKGKSAAETAELLLRIAADPIRRAVDYKAGDLFTLTIFKREARTAAEGERMHPIAREWTDPAAADGGRSWEKGKGYTGVLWSMASANRKISLVEPDTSLEGVREKYPVDTADLQRENRYRSIASFPITIGPDDGIWGIVTATSSRPLVFDHRGDLARQSVETVRDVALIAGLLAKLDGL
jgi:hypothetical protein